MNFKAANLHSLNLTIHILHRASKLLGILRKEEFDILKKGKIFPEIKPGDSIAIDMVHYVSATETHTIKGVVVAKINRASDTAVKLLNVSSI